MIAGLRSPHKDVPRADGAGTFETAVFWSALVVQVAVRVLYLLHHHVDTDEPQHLHVAWGWTHGLVQYRDVFDNHAPLFHLMAAPLVRALGERADILVILREWMLPLTLLSLVATYILGRALWSERVGRWAALVAGFGPTFLLTSTEFRADILWMATWLWALVVMLGGRPTGRRGLLAGLLLGAALATSLKSVLLLLSLASAGAFVLAVERGSLANAARLQLRRFAAAVAAGTIAIPAAVVGLFWRLRALPAMAYCTVQHNIVPGLGLWQRAPYRPLLFPLALSVMLPSAKALLGWQPASPASTRRVVVFLTAGMYLALLEAFWPLITREDFLPSTPLCVLLMVAAAYALWTALGRIRRRAMPRWAWAGFMALVMAAELALVTDTESAWRDATRTEGRLLQTVLRATRPADPILDLKGETVFRPRPYYFVLEGVTKTRLAMHLLPDRIAADVIRSRTHYAVPDSPYFPPAARQYLNRHFVTFGALRVLGTDLGVDPCGDGNHRHAFDVSYPERFAIVVDGRAARGNLDDVPYRGPRWLAPGVHQYVPAPGERRSAAIWSDALARDPEIGARVAASP